MSTTNIKWLPPQQEGFGPWIEFTGKKRPVPAPQCVQVLLGAERQRQTYGAEEQRADDWYWSPRREARHRVVAYCVKLGEPQVEQPSASGRSVQAPDTALAVQVAGDHYKRLAIQPIEYIHANGMTYLAGNVVKYISRHKAKGGADDVRKAIHYCELILELEYKNGKTD